MSVYPFRDQGNWTAVHNVVFDVLMPMLPPNAYKVVCAVIRHTVGFHREAASLSYDDLKRLTGIRSDATLSAALRVLTPQTNPLLLVAYGTSTERSSYRLNPAYRAPTAAQEPTCTSESEAQPSSDSEVRKKERILNTREGGRERARAAQQHTPHTNAKQLADDPIIEEPTHAADLPPAVADVDRAAVYTRWQEMWGAWTGGTPPARLARVFDDWAAVHGWSGIHATLRYADARYDLATNPNVINLLGAMLDNARADNRPYGTHTTQYQQHTQERQHERQRAARVPRSRGRRRDAAAPSDHSVQSDCAADTHPDAPRPAVAERPAPRFVQRLRAQAAQAEHGGR